MDHHTQLYRPLLKTDDTSQEDASPYGVEIWAGRTGKRLPVARSLLDAGTLPAGPATREQR